MTIGQLMLLLYREAPEFSKATADEVRAALDELVASAEITSWSVVRYIAAKRD